MRNINEYILEPRELTVEEMRSMIYCSELENAGLITESLNEPHLLILAKQLADLLKLTGHKVNFGYLFGDMGYKWDQIDASRVKEYEFITQPTIQAARKVLTGNGFVILCEKDWTYYRLIKNSGSTEKYYIDLYLPDDQRYARWNSIRWNPTTASEAYLDIERASHIIVVNLNGLDKDMLTFDLKWQRQQSRVDMIPTDPKQYKTYCDRIARENRSRYKLIIEQNRAKKNADFEKVDLIVQRCLDKMMKASMMVLKDPIKWAPEKYKLTMMLEAIYGNQHYDRGHVYGRNGILNLFSSYNSCYIDVASGNSSSYTNNERLKKYEEDIIKEADYLQKMYFSVFGL